LVQLSDHDRQALALAKRYPWVCPHCHGGLDDAGNFESLWVRKTAERAHYLALAQTLRTVETPGTLAGVCEGLRAALAPGSEVRYAWADAAPELLRELWAVMEKIGGAAPARPVALKGKPSVTENAVQDVLDGLNDVVGWCHARLAKAPEGAANPPDNYADFRDGPGGPLLTPKYCKERFNVSGKDLSQDPEAKKTRRKNPAGRDGGDYVYRYDVVARIANRKADDG
jgi:hypothetical protein